MNQCTTAAAAAAAAAVATTASAQHAANQILDLLIIGGGLSGLFVAHDFHHRVETTTTPSSPSHSSWKLLEARSVLGGRLKNDDKGHLIDLGGAWVWPHHQSNLRYLLPRLDNIRTFQQPDDPSSTRIEGGAVKLIETLFRNLPEENIVLNAPVTKCTLVEASENGNDETYIQVEIETRATNAIHNNDKNDSDKNQDSSSTTIFRARRVVIAVPPKLISKHIQFDPPLSLAKQQAMAASHTWMAGVTKVAVVYPTPFWRDNDANKSINTLQTNMGLPTHLGPAFQVYDASTRTGNVAAVTFFCLVTPNDSATQSDDQVLAKQVLHQLARVWDYMEVDQDVIQQLLHSFTDVHVQRWPLEEYISEDPAPNQIHPHPHSISALAKSEWNGKLLFAGSESDLESPGVMEGAIGAALRVLRDIP